MSSTTSPRVVVIGIGLHGTRIANTLLDQGVQLVGAADPATAGRQLSEVLGRPGAYGDSSVATDASELAAEVAPEVAVVTAPVDLDGLKEIAFSLFDYGVNVVTIHPDAFDPPEPWATQVDERARAKGVSFLATGVQDVWWVHVPAAAAAATSSLTRVTIDHATNADTLSVGLGRLFGLGQPESAFANVRDEVLLAEESVLGGPLRVLAKRLGLTPGDAQREIRPILADEPIAWETGETVVEAGCLMGFVEEVHVGTEEGVDFHGLLRTALLEPGQLPTDRVELVGDPVLHLEHRPFPGDRITDIVPIARVRDIVAASPGLHTAATMPSASYQHTPSDSR